MGTKTAIQMPNGLNIEPPDVQGCLTHHSVREKPNLDKTIIKETLLHSRSAVTQKIAEFIVKERFMVVTIRYTRC